MELLWNYSLREYIIFTKPHNYNTRQNSLPSNGNSNSETSEIIINLESKLLLRFDNLDKEMLNLKDVIIKDLQVETKDCAV